MPNIDFTSIENPLSYVTEELELIKRERELIPREKVIIEREKQLLKRRSSGKSQPDESNIQQAYGTDTTTNRYQPRKVWYNNYNCFRR